MVHIELDGSQAGPAVDGLRILAGGTGISALAIYGFAGNGIVLSGNAGNVVSGCFVGVDRAGNVRGNGGAGVLISGSADNSIGFEGQIVNIFEGNREGIRIEGPGADRNDVLGNYIGGGPFYSHTFGNLEGGIIVLNARSTLLIGNSVVGGHGVGVTLGPGSSENVVLGNGMDGSTDGILLDGSSRNQIGGVHYLNTANVIVSCTGHGIHLVHGANDNFVIGNRIGRVDERPDTFQLGNNGDGIRIEDSSRNLIGYKIVVDFELPQNFIAFNGGAGVSVVGDSSGNTITENSIWSNGGLGIDLGSDGVTANHSGGSPSGPDRLQNHPVLSRVSVGRRGRASFEGTVNGVAGQTVLLEFFGSPTCNASPPDDFGEGLLFIGSASVRISESGGDNAFSISFDPSPVIGALMTLVEAGQSITATATDEQGNTSEFSQCVTAVVDVSGPQRPRTVAVRPRG